MQPLISVILPVYNGLPYLEEAIKSVLSQSCRDFELIIINDGSRDDSAAVIERIIDRRIRFYQQENRGLAATLNRAISLAKGKYIARQDQDDISLQYRFEKQVAFLDAHPDVGMVGTGAEIWVGNKRSDRLLVHPADNASIKFGMLFDNRFVHSSVMIRRSVFEDTGGYTEDATRQPPEDYELWSRVMRKYKLANLPEVLLKYREVEGSMSRTGANPFLPNLIKISAENIAWASGHPVDSSDVIAISKLSRGIYDQIPLGARLSGMKAVLKQAAHKIAGDAADSSSQLMNSAMRRQIYKLQYHYMDYRCAGLIGKVVNNKIGRSVKKLARRML